MARRFVALALIAMACAAGSAHASVTISTDRTSNMSCSAGVCSPTAKKAVLNVTDLTNLLASADVKITTGNGAVTITVISPFSWTSTHRLTLDAYYNATFQAPVTVAGTGAVSIVTNDGGTGGNVTFSGKGRLSFWDLNSLLIINRHVYKLFADVRGLADQIEKNPNRHYALAKSYNASADGTYAAIPIPTTFAGTFDGLGHSISNLNVDVGDVSNVGFFALISATGIVRNVKFQNATMTSKGKYASVGILAGQNQGKIRNVTTEGLIASGGDATNEGGLVGVNSGTILSCATSGSIIASGNISSGGGLVGANGGGIVQSHSSASVGALNAGGLVGYNAVGTIAFSYATGDASAGSASPPLDPMAGGLVGYNGGTIEQSFATGSVYGGSGHEGSKRDSIASGGGLVGISGGQISNSYATGPAAVGDVGYAGGFAGDAFGISNSYSIGTATALGDSYAGGFVGTSASDDVSDYWDTDTSGTQQGCGQDSCAGVTGVSDAQLKSGLPAGFDPGVWAQSPSINNGFPYLIANPPPQ